MIARLAGTLVEKSPTGSIVDVHGVGYQLLHSLGTFEDLPDVGTPVTLLTHLHVREDALQLYGFARADERSAFELLLSVSGVGPKVALAVLSGLSPGAFARAVADENLAALTRVAGVGKKTAERIVVDLRDRLAGAGLVPAPGAPGEAKRTERAGAAGSPVPEIARSLPGRLWEDAVGALVALGLTRAGAMEHVHQALESGPAESVEELVRRALAASAQKPKSAAPRGSGRARAGAGV